MKSTLKNLYAGAKKTDGATRFALSVMLVVYAGAGILLSWLYRCILPCLYYEFTSGHSWVTLSLTVLGFCLLLLLTVPLLYVAPSFIRMFYTELLEALKLEEAIECNHGDTLAEVAKNIRKSPIEYRVIFGDKETKLAEGTLLSSHKCNIPHDTLMRVQDYRCIDLHNHPNDVAGFSPGDLWAHGSIQPRLAIVATKKLVCSMYYPENFWKEHCGRELKDYYDELAESTDSALLSLSNPTVTSQYYITLTQLVANHFGLEFHCERFKSWYKANSMPKKKRLDPLFGRPTQKLKTDP